MIVPSLPIVKQKIQYSDLVFIFLFVGWVVRYLKGNVKFQKVPAGFALLAMLSIFLLSFINSQEKLISSIDFLGIFYLVCLYFLLTQLVTFEDIWWRLLKCWVVISLILAFSGICAYFISFIGIEHNFLLVKHDFYQSVNAGLVRRLCSVFRHPAMLATYLHVSIVFSFILAVKLAINEEKYLSYVFCIVLCIIAAILTKTKISAGIALTLFLILAALPYEKLIVSIAKYISFLCAVLLFIFVFSVNVWWILPVNIHEGNNDTLVIEFNSIHHLSFIRHKALLKMINDYPLIGVGMGMYNFESARYITWEETKKSLHVIHPHLTEKEENRYKRGGVDPHSTYIGWCAETGLLGLGGILFFFFQIISALVMRGKGNSDTTNRFVYKAMVAGFAGFLLNAWYIDILTMRHFWVFVSMAAIYMQLKDKTYSSEQNEVAE